MKPVIKATFSSVSLDILDGFRVFAIEVVLGVDRFGGKRLAYCDAGVAPPPLTEDYLESSLKLVDRMPEPELIDHAGLDSAVYIRIYLLGLKKVVPIALLAFGVLLPVNYTGGNFNTMSLSMKDLTFGEIDKFSVSNVPPTSKRLIVHIVMAYAFTLQTNLFGHQFTVLVRNVPSDPDESVSEHVDHFFRVNHPDQYFLHKACKSEANHEGFWGLWGEKIDAIDYYTEEIEKLSKEVRNTSDDFLLLLKNW
ncbi:hypothetical protein QVD17_19316 [Tagetes erecta]|uniref:Uncharacterized protein n=1 Tax=Tagetes erecta TaxID=13708 RepID=A0AAD8NPY2_TARER|nr:hypothetical protein QVD17_19316 [Tagetes erecta]